MNKKRIYLAGPISGLTYQQAAHGWRAKMARLLPEFDLMSPMRGKEHLAQSKTVLSGAYGERAVSSQAGILGRDRNDVRTCNLMIANFLEDDGNVSIGTSMEFGWADAWRKPVILVAEPDNRHRKHPMLNGASTYVVETLEEAADLARLLLLPERPKMGLWEALPGNKQLRLSLVNVTDVENFATGQRIGKAEVVVDVVDSDSGEVLYSFGKQTLKDGNHAILIKLDAEVKLDV